MIFKYIYSMSLTGRPLRQKIEFVKGVGSSRAEVLRKELGVQTVEDLLNIFPFRYDDRSEFSLIKDLRNGDSVQLKGTLISLEKVKGRSRNMLKGMFKDPSGFLELTWFQGVKWISEMLHVNQEYVLFGKVKIYKGQKSIVHPEMELAAKAESQSAFLPVYSSTDLLNRKNLGVRARRTILENIFRLLKESDKLVLFKVISVLKI